MPSQTLSFRLDARERLARCGPGALDDIDLLTTLIGSGQVGAPAPLLARRVLDSVGDPRNLASASLGQLTRIPGIGAASASRILAAIELGQRAVTRPLGRRRPLRSSKDVDAALRPRLSAEPVELFVAIPLDAKHRPMGEHVLARGGLTSCPVEPASVFRVLIRDGAAAVVLVHNHPSGVPEPSPQDVALTRRLVRAGRVLGVEVLDHVIVAAEGFFSFLDAGLMGRGA